MAKRAPKLSRDQTILFDAIAPPDTPGIEILNLGALPGIEEIRRRQNLHISNASHLPLAEVVHIDPPWSYDNEAHGKSFANPDMHGFYSSMSLTDISEVLRATYDLGAPGSRLVMWLTWPILAQLLQRTKLRGFSLTDSEISAIKRASGSDVGEAIRLTQRALKRRAIEAAAPLVISEDLIKWSPVTGGSWHKKIRPNRPQQGVGVHWLGASELALIYRKPGATVNDRSSRLHNAHESVPGDHSEKPIGWLVDMLNRWTTEPLPPLGDSAGRRGGLVVDIFSGLAPMARACLEADREYIGIDIDSDRCSSARARLAQHTGIRL